MPTIQKVSVVTQPTSPGGGLIDLPAESTGILPHGRYEGIEVQDDGIFVGRREKITLNGNLTAVIDPVDATRVKIVAIGTAGGVDVQENGVDVVGNVTDINARNGLVASAGVAGQANLDVDYGLTTQPLGPAAPGVSNKLSREDHVHEHGNQGGGTLHALATPTVAGFMSPADKAKVDALVFGQNYQTAVSEGRSTTTSSIFQTKIALTTPALTGTYRVSWTAKGDAYGNPGEWRLQNVTDNVTVDGPANMKTQTADGRIHVGGFREVVFSGVAKTFEIQWRNPDGGSTVGIEQARIEIWRVS